MYNSIKRTFFTNNHANFILTLVVISFNSMFIIGLSYFLQSATDLAIAGDLKSMQPIVIGGLLTIGGLVVNWFIERQVRNRFVERAEFQYKEFVFSNIMKKSISSFMSENTSTYVSAMTNDLHSIEMYYLQGTFDLILQVLFFMGALSMMLWYSVYLTFLVIVLIGICGAATLSMGKKLTEEEKMVSSENEAFVYSVKNLLSGYNVIKSFKAEESITAFFTRQNSGLEGRKCTRRKLESLINLISSSTGLLVQTGVIFLGARLAIKGQLTIGGLVAFVQLMGIMVGPIQTIPKLYSNRKAAISLIKKIADNLGVNMETKNSETIHNLSKGIEYKDLSFSYEEGNPVLNNINLSFEIGKSYLVVGPSGCGKSTLVNLLLGGYDNYQGTIRIGETELRDIDKDVLYETVSSINQSSFIFDGTILENITMFRDKEFSNLDIVLKQSGLNNVIQEKGVDYQCGENGIGLSGGEKQRVAIARCLLINNPIVIMDEGTAALDINTAFFVENEILDIEGITRIVISHRLHEELMKRYDEIIVIKDGSIVERGSYSILMESKGHLFSMITNK